MMKAEEYVCDYLNASDRGSVCGSLLNRKSNNNPSQVKFILYKWGKYYKKGFEAPVMGFTILNESKHIICKWC